MYAYPAPFEYHRPETVEEATELLAGHEGEAAALAGGMSLIPKLKARQRRPAHVVDIGRLAELRGEPRVNGSLVVPALTSYRELSASAAVRDAVPALADAAGQLADPQVRNAGTIGGAVAEVYPGADLPATLLALDARLRCVGPDGEATRTVEEQFAAGDRVASGPAELVVAVEVPLPADRAGAAHVRLERRSGLAVLGCAACVTLDEQGHYATVRAALHGLRPAPVAVLTDGGLEGREPAGAVHREAAEAATSGLESFDDLRGSAEYRRQVAAAVLARALDRAAERAGAQQGGDR
jgi:aerobic carbon-monoxide dehydrogenase medium subunit